MDCHDASSSTGTARPVPLEAPRGRMMIFSKLAGPREVTAIL